MTVKFPETSWYGQQAWTGWNKLLMIGKFIHYADYTTVAWKWVDAEPGDPNAFKGRVLKLAAFYHDDWNLFKWVEFDGTFPLNEPINLEIVRYKNQTDYFCWVGETMGDKSKTSQVISVDVGIAGNWIMSPYFGGRSKAQYTHCLDIEIG